MRYLFLTACRNEERILDEFLDELRGAVASAGLADRSTLYIVDDLSTDRSREVVRAWAARNDGLSVELIEAPTNFGNQGAMFFGLCRISCSDDDVLITLDCDGEDDVRQFRSILEVGEANPGKLVLIERGRRAESLLFKIMFATYKAIFRFFARQRVVPNNFMLVPGRFVAAIRVSPLAAVHFAYAILRLGIPYVAVTRDRRPRYGGQTSQNIFTLVSHGLVGLMAFYETVIAKLFVILVVFGAWATAVTAVAVAMPADRAGLQRVLLWSAVAAGAGGVGLFALLLAAGLALIFKVTVFSQIQVAIERSTVKVPPRVDPTDAAPHN